MQNQKEFHAYDGTTYVGLVVATDAQFADTGYTAGAEPPEPIPSTDPRDYPLTPRQFNRFAALHGYDDAIDGKRQRNPLLALDF